MIHLQRLALRFFSATTSDGTCALVPVLDALEAAGTLHSCTKLGLRAFRCTLQLCEQMHRLPSLRHVGGIFVYAHDSTDRHMLDLLALCLSRVTSLTVKFVRTPRMGHVLGDLTQLQHLDVSSETATAVITAIAGLSLLTHLKLQIATRTTMQHEDKLRLTTILGSSLTALQTLVLKNMECHDAVDIFPNCLMHLKNLRCFAFNGPWTGGSLTGMGVVSCLEQLERFEMDCLDDSEVAVFAVALVRLRKLQSISLVTTSSFESLQSLATPISHATCLTAVDLHTEGTDLTCEEENTLSRMFNGLPKLKKWSISSACGGWSSGSNLIVLKAGECVE